VQNRLTSIKLMAINTKLPAKTEMLSIREHSRNLNVSFFHKLSKGPRQEKKTGEIDYVVQLSITKSIKHRLPWLIIGLAGGVLASRIVDSFENTLSENLILAAFIPLIVYMSDAVGTQMEAFVIRDFSLHTRLKFRRYFMRHLVITIAIASTLAVLLFAFSITFHEGIRLAIALSVSLFFSIISSVFTGLFLPLLFRSLRLDPANASGPIATIIQDILSITIYFSIASMLL